MTACVFAAYSVVVSYAGIDRFGVWSLLISMSMFIRSADVSGGGTLSRFLALSRSGGDEASPWVIVDTVVMTSLGINLVLAICFYSVAISILPLIIQSPYLAEALQLVPFAAVAMFLGGAAGAVIAGIDGVHRADQRAVLVVVASVALLASSAALVPSFGIIGFGVAIGVQQAVMLIAGWLILRRHLPGLHWVPLRWSRSVFRETTGYSLKMMAIGLVSSITDPLAKAAINSAGGPALVGLYELALRLVLQVRAPFVSAATALIPAFSSLGGTEHHEFRSLFQRMTRIASLGALSVAAASLLLCPVVSIIVLGKVTKEFLLICTVLAAAHAINVIAIPSYFAAQSLGQLRWNFVSQSITAALAVVAVGAGPLGGVPAVVGLVAVGVIVGAVVTMVGNVNVLRIHPAPGEWTYYLSATLGIAAMSIAAALASTSLV